MPGDYVTVALALALAYQMVAPEWDEKQGPKNTIAVLISLVSLECMPWISFSSLRVEWLVSGLALIGYAIAGVGKRRLRLPLLVLALDAAGGWIALSLTGASHPAIIAGAAAGSLLPAALGPWPRKWEGPIQAAAVILTGALGLRQLSKAIFAGGVHWPLGLLAIPWLIIWDWWGGRAAPSIQSIR